MCVRGWGGEAWVSGANVYLVQNTFYKLLWIHFTDYIQYELLEHIGGYGGFVYRC